MSSLRVPWMGGVLTLLTVAAFVWLARLAADAPATSDTAVLAISTRLAAQGRLLLGAYSRFQWHHPGPLYFYVLAPFYAASGWKIAGLRAGAAALSLGSLGVIAWTLGRRAPTAVALASSATLALLIWRAAEAVASPWNPHVLLVASAALVVTSADALAGGVVMVPVVALLASLTGQAHVGMLPTALVLGVSVVARAGIGHLRSESRAWGPALRVTMVVLAVAWAPPIYEQLTAQPRGNLTELWDFFINRETEGQPFIVAVSAFSDMLVAILRPDFMVASGVPFIESPVRWAEWLSLLALAFVSLRVVAGLRARQLTFETALGFALLMTGMVAVWSFTRVDERLFDHDVFWVAGPGALTLGMAVASLASLFPFPRGRSWAALAPLASALLLAVGVVASVSALRDASRRSFDPPPDARASRALAHDLRRWIDREQVVRPLIRIPEDGWGITAGAILELFAEGRPVSVPDDWLVMFAPMFRQTGTEEAVVAIVNETDHVRLQQQGVPLLSAHPPVFAHLEGVSGR